MKAITLSGRYWEPGWEEANTVANPDEFNEFVDLEIPFDDCPDDYPLD